MPKKNAKSKALAVKPKVSKSRGNNPGDGSVMVSRLELLSSVSAVSGSKETSGALPITPGSCTWLNTMSASFERYRWESVQIYWRGATGTTFGGLIAFGVDWTGRAKLSGVAIDRKKVTGLTPLCDVPVWTDSSSRPLNLPKNELQTRPWYGLGDVSEIDAGPGNLAYSVYHDSVSADKFLGEFWIRYRVRLQGTTVA